MAVDQTTQDFNRYRGLLFSIAYRMLGSASDAEDMVQEAFIRWLKTDEEEIDSPKAYLATTVIRICIDYLRSARIQREQYVGPWLPEPILTGPHPGLAETVAQEESISYAFMILLEKLNPLERAVFLMREAFDYPYSEIARMVGKSEDNCRQILHRAHQHLDQFPPRFEVSYAKKKQITELFLRAIVQGDMQGFLNLLADDIVFAADGGGKVPAAIHFVHGKDKVSRGMLGPLRPLLPSLQTSIEQINGQPAILGYVDGKLYGVMLLESDGEQIHSIYTILNPDKLHGVEAR